MSGCSNAGVSFLIIFPLSVELGELRHIILDLLDGLVSVYSRYDLDIAVAFLNDSVDYH